MSDKYIKIPRCVVTGRPLCDMKTLLRLQEWNSEIQLPPPTPPVPLPHSDLELMLMLLGGKV